MSVTGAWIVGAVPDRAVRRVRSTPAGNPPPAPESRDEAAELAWWRGRAHAPMFTPSVSCPGDWIAGEDAVRLSAFLHACHDDSEHAERLRDTVMDLFPPDAGEGLFMAAARGADPFSALAHALGPDATLRLPGRFGDFLLDAGQVRARLPVVERTLALTGTRRRDAVERIHMWTTGLGDDPAHDADELLDGPLRVLRHAARTGLGAAGQVRWY
ncbi:hypothetical protein [Streptomyces fructofermentans]|uniref:Uncharacterized protein n=1 Tax=Streptomyces fructofermentans TaxID=152141 RepID=A0A918JZ76_9ACTN|nr:hypothetical protein [Streptomyces fructofermentans]GGX39485.1 hypothetical protein GCM10010515_02390 [Streptomyces fructofermentans]